MKRIIVLSIALLMLGYNTIAQRQKVIFDCDLGGDIDDAFALALLLTSQDKFDILGITMDHGHTPGRAEMACKILYEVGMENIPVFIGDHTPNIVGKHADLEGYSTQMTWSAGFDKVQPENEHAADFIIRMLNKFPGEVILFTVGPVDNIANMLDKEPHILKKAKKIVSMFGSIEKGYNGRKPEPEWNVRASIEAGQRLMQSGAKITLAPVGITDHVIFTSDFLTALSMRNTPLTNALGSLYSLWYNHADWATRVKLFDCVAIGMVLWPELFETKEAYVYVDEKGMTLIDNSKPANCSYGVKINDKVFLNKMYRKIMEQNFQR